MLGWLAGGKSREAPSMHTGWPMHLVSCRRQVKPLVQMIQNGVVLEPGSDGFSIKEGDAKVAEADWERGGTE